MSTLVIKGHATRGSEVIEILEMLGGNNLHEYVADSDCFGFYISKGLTNNIYYDQLHNFAGGYTTVFTLEEFLKKFPHKVGDKVCFSDDLSTPFTINKMWWDENANELLCSFAEDDIEVPVEDLQPYKEELMENNINYCQVGKIAAVCFQDTNYEDKVELQLGNKYEIKQENGKYYAVKKQFKYPTSYEECCNVLSIPPYYNLRYLTYEHGYNEYATVNKLCSLQDKLNILGKLLICRDAYWKVYGEQMGFGESWEPSDSKHNYIIRRAGDEVLKCYNISCILEFPTPEMRDTFFENFKELIEKCKELL